MGSIIISRGECLHASLAWTDEDGNPIDITGRDFAVFDAAPAFTAEFSITDAAAGRVDVTVADTSMLLPGRTNRFRLSMTLPGGCSDTTPPIWIEVQ